MCGESIRGLKDFPQSAHRRQSENSDPEEEELLLGGLCAPRSLRKRREREMARRREGRRGNKGAAPWPGRNASASLSHLLSESHTEELRVPVKVSGKNNNLVLTLLSSKSKLLLSCNIKKNK